MTITDMENRAEIRAEASLSNRLMKRLSDILGLTTGIGVIAWGMWSLLITIGLTVYERSGLTPLQVQIEDAFNQGMLQSSMLIVLGAIVLELRRLSERLIARQSNG